MGLVIIFGILAIWIYLCFRWSQPKQRIEEHDAPKEIAPRAPAHVSDDDAPATSVEPHVAPERQVAPQEITRAVRQAPVTEATADSRPKGAEPTNEEELLSVRTPSGQATPPWARRINWENRPENTDLAIFVDTETTGLSGRDELIEIALVLFCFDRPSGEIRGIIDFYAGQREPTCEINPHAAKVNGFTREILEGQTIDMERAESILQKSDLLMAHNAPFDKRFVSSIFPGVARKRWLCSMSDIDWTAYGMKSRALRKLATAHGIKSPKTHGALVDATVSLLLLQMAAPSGQRYLADLLKADAPPPQKKNRTARAGH